MQTTVDPLCLSHLSLPCPPSHPPVAQGALILGEMPRPLPALPCPPPGRGLCGADGQPGLRLPVAARWPWPRPPHPAYCFCGTRRDSRRTLLLVRPGGCGPDPHGVASPQAPGCSKRASYRPGLYTPTAPWQHILGSSKCKLLY